MLYSTLAIQTMIMLFWTTLLIHNYISGIRYRRYINLIIIIIYYLIIKPTTTIQCCDDDINMKYYQVNSKNIL